MEQEYVHLKSLTFTGVAGSVIMIISNSLWVGFAIQAKWTALFISFVIALIVFLDRSEKFFQKLLFYPIVAVTFFCVSLGMNTFGVAVTSDPVQDRHVSFKSDKEFRESQAVTTPKSLKKERIEEEVLRKKRKFFSTL